MEINKIINQLNPPLTASQATCIGTILKSNTLTGPKDLEKRLIKDFVLNKEDERITRLQDIISKEIRSQHRLFRDNPELGLGFYYQNDLDKLMATGMSQEDALQKLLKPQSQINVPLEFWFSSNPTPFMVPNPFFFPFPKAERDDTWRRINVIPFPPSLNDTNNKPVLPERLPHLSTINTAELIIPNEALLSDSDNESLYEPLYA